MSNFLKFKAAVTMQFRLIPRRLHTDIIIVESRCWAKNYALIFPFIMNIQL